MMHSRAPNRLVNETSPYLQQHAHNPVDWWPWCNEAFGKAIAEDKPIFLSIGYSTCHWCHVLERESFEDEEVAKVLNENFISIKVDREERPDIDSVYMSACIMLSGSGGWPLSVFLTHERKPFFAGTYYPKEDNYNMPGIMTILQRIALMWQSGKHKLIKTGEDITDLISRSTEGGHEQEKISDKITGLARVHLLKSEDADYGGFGGAPKFPSPHNLMFLMRSAFGEAHGNHVWQAVLRALNAMANGGIRDHVGGGFCRYSTDRQWLVPHFEKMLYDNALLIMAYSEAYSKTSDPRWEAIAKETIAFVLKEMCSPENAFYTAIDADSEGEEGKFYTWSADEVSTVLKSDAKKFCELCNVTLPGNFDGANIINTIKANGARKEAAFLKKCCEKLYAARSSRIRPFTDKKILLTNNSLMIAALCKAAVVFGVEEYAKTAVNAINFLFTEMIVQGDPLAVHGKGDRATLDGYAYLIWALLEAYQACFNHIYLVEALRLAKETLRLFGKEDGGLYYAVKNELPVRMTNAQDGAVPSGQSVFTHCLITLSHLTGDYSLENAAKSIIDSLAADVNRAPTGYCHLLSAILYLEMGGVDVVLTAGEGIEKMFAALKGYSPFMSVQMANEHIFAIAPFTKGMTPIEGKATAYVCRGKTCDKPTTDPVELQRKLFD